MKYENYANNLILVQCWSKEAVKQNLLKKTQTNLFRIKQEADWNK